MPEINFHNMDCLEFMKDIPDKHYDLAIVDPPYGINVANMAYLREIKTKVKQRNGTKLSPHKNKNIHKFSDWDKSIPSQGYFNELVRVSKHQIIFGINYMDWKGVGVGRIKWDKGVADGVSFNRYEIAYCSCIDNHIDLPLLWSGMFQAKSLLQPKTQQGNKKLNQKRIHPTEKPILLYKWLLKNYAQPGDKIFDSHGGSMSIAIACDEMGFDLDICEIDKDFFNDAVDRFNQHKQQLKIAF